MKFLCPSCKAKYQIADQKVAGRKLKMTCRQCGEEIVIRGDARRGTESASPSAGAPASNLSQDFQKRVASGPVAPPLPAQPDQWHVAINDIPVGPMRREEVAQKIHVGAVGPDSLAWREGLDDWLPVGKIPELMALCTAALRTSMAPAQTFSAPPVASTAPADRAPLSPIGARNAAPSTDMFEPVAQPPAPAPYPAPPTGPTPPPPVAPPLAATTGSYVGPMPQQPVYSQDGQGAGRGTPGWAQMFLFVCGGAFILAVGLLLGTRVVGPAQQQQQVVAPPVKPTEPEESAAPQRKPALDIPDPATDVADLAAPEAPHGEVEDHAQVAAPTGAKSAAKVRRPASKKSETAKGKDLTAAQREMLARMGGSSSSTVSRIRRTKTGSGAKDSPGGEGLNAQQLASVVNKGKRSLQRCYETALRGSGSTDTVRLDVEVTVSASGNVSRVKAKGKSLPGMDKCISSTVRTWRFPKSGGSTTTQFPILFQPGS